MERLYYTPCLEPQFQATNWTSESESTASDRIGWAPSKGPEDSLFPEYGGTFTARPDHLRPPNTTSAFPNENEITIYAGAMHALWQSDCQHGVIQCQCWLILSELPSPLPLRSFLRLLPGLMACKNCGIESAIACQAMINDKTLEMCISKKYWGRLLGALKSALGFDRQQRPKFPDPGQCPSYISSIEIREQIQDAIRSYIGDTLLYAFLRQPNMNLFSSSRAARTTILDTTAALLKARNEQQWNHINAVGKGFCNFWEETCRSLEESQFFKRHDSMGPVFSSVRETWKRALKFITEDLQRGSSSWDSGEICSFLLLVCILDPAGRSTGGTGTISQHTSKDFLADLGRWSIALEGSKAKAIVDEFISVVWPDWIESPSSPHWRTSDISNAYAITGDVLRTIQETLLRKDTEPTTGMHWFITRYLVSMEVDIDVDKLSLEAMVMTGKLADDLQLQPFDECDRFISSGTSKLLPGKKSFSIDPGIPRYLMAGAIMSIALAFLSGYRFYGLSSLAVLCFVPYICAFEKPLGHSCNPTSSAITTNASNIVGIHQDDDAHSGYRAVMEELFPELLSSDVSQHTTPPATPESAARTTGTTTSPYTDYLSPQAWSSAASIGQLSSTTDSSPSSGKGLQYPCSYFFCRCAFPTTSNRNRHERTAHGEKIPCPFHSNGCTKTIVDRTDFLEKHKRLCKFNQS